MKAKKVKEVMVPLSEYATVSDEDTLKTAMQVLRKARDDKRHPYAHRAVLVFGQDGSITGKVSLFDILKALEPKYRQFENRDHASSIGLSRFGLSQGFLNSLLEHYELWDESLEDLVKQASGLPVKDIMYTPGEGEYVEADAPLAEAVHQFILGCHQSLLVIEDGRVAGILKLSDLFDLISDI